MSRASAAHAVLFQRRILTIITTILAFGFVLWIVAISTDYWNIVDGGEGIYVEKTKRYFLQSHHGLWKSCRTSYSNKTALRPAIITDRCAYINFFPTTPQHSAFAHYQRTVAAFSIITLVIKLLGFVFSIYTFNHTRFMYKRLAACSHFLAAACDLIVLEVGATAIYFAAAKLPFRHPPGSEWHFGYSTVLAWGSFFADIIAALGFAICSKKRKKNKAPTYEFAVDEEHTIIGR